MSAARGRVICGNCHQPIDPSTALRFCSVTCGHEWSSTLMHAQTPEQVWNLVEAIRPFILARQRDAPEQAMYYGHLLVAAKAYWPELRHVMHAAARNSTPTPAPEHDPQQTLPGVDLSKEALK